MQASTVAKATEGTAEQTVRASAEQAERKAPEASSEQTVQAQPNVQPSPQESSPAWQAARKPGNSLFDPTPADGAGSTGGWHPFQSASPADQGESAAPAQPSPSPRPSPQQPGPAPRPGQSAQPGQFAAFRDETPDTPDTPDNSQGWAAFRPVTARDEQTSEPAREGWAAFRSDSGGADEARSGSARPESPTQPPAASPGGPGSVESRLAGASFESPTQSHAESAGAAAHWPGGESADQAPEPAPSWPGQADSGPREPWSQRIDVPVRPGLPEPPPGTVPPAGAGAARPMRIGPAGEQFPAEATVGIPRPAEFPTPDQPQFPAEATVGIPRPAAGFPGTEQGPPPAGPEQIPAQADAEQPPPASGGPAQAEKKPRRKLLVLAIVVLLVLVAAGGASAVPAVANKLGLPWAPNAPKGSAPEPADASLALHGPDESTPGASANGVGSALSGPAAASALANLSGSVIDPANGTVLWDHSSNTPLTPASTTKILTVSAALLAMEPTKRISTKIVQGADPGTVVLVGGGDPSLTALPVGTDSPLYPGAAHIDDLVNQVKKADSTISKVQVDVSAYTGPVTAPGWEASDAPSLFGAPIVPVMADGGRNNPKADETMRAANPATAVTQLVADKLGASAAGTTKAPEGAKVLGEVQSAPLPDLAYALLQISDNVLADALGRQVAMATGGDPSFEGASAAVKKVLGDHGFDVNGLQLFDTSGLSSKNKVPAR
ncbi:MAG: D-alanyl-D-alanine carboxypeptidase, partial [Kitasatospora sp.]|nr:D-alanyl-D-alanine carboxypeptidase [Kitasatospora sp.]